MTSGWREPEPWQTTLREDDIRDVHGGDRQTGNRKNNIYLPMLLCIVDLFMEGIHLFTMLFRTVFSVLLWIIFSVQLLTVLSNYTGWYSACYSEWYPAWFHDGNQHVSRRKGNIYRHGGAYLQSCTFFILHNRISVWRSKSRCLIMYWNIKKNLLVTNRKDQYLL